MIRRHGAHLRALLMGADVAVAVGLAVAISFYLFDEDWVASWDRALPSPVIVLVLFVIAWVACLWAHGLYRMRERWSLASDARRVFQAVVWLAVGTFSVLYLGHLEDTSRLFVLSLLASLYLVTLAERAVIRAGFEALRRRGKNLRHVLVLGTGPLALQFATTLENHPELGLRVVGFLNGSPHHLPARWAHLGAIEELPRVLHEQVVDEVAICLTSQDWLQAEEIVRLCETEGKIVRMPVPMPSLTIARTHVEELDGVPIVSFLTGPGSALALGLKQVLDHFVAAAAIVVLLPLLATISAAIVLVDGRPIFFRQERVGLHGRRFNVLKFRTMVPDAEERLAELRMQNEVSGHAFKVSDDPRITRIGSFLRRSSLDELPQLWNVLRGEMSLVGPRPPLPAEVAGYDLWHRRRLSMKPGITGLWQIEGRRDPEFDRWVRKDLEYIDRWSPWLDVKILVRTIPALLRAEGR